MTIDCKELNAHAEPLHRVAAKTLARAREVGEYDRSYVNRLRAFVFTDEAAHELEKLIAEDC